MTQPGVPTSAGAHPDSPLAHEVGLRTAVAEGRLRLAGLDGAARRLAVLAIGVLAGAAAVVLARSFGVGVPGGVIEVPGAMVAESGVVDVPILAVAAFLVGFAVVSAVQAASAVTVPRRSSRVVLAGLAFTSAAASAPALTVLPAATVLLPTDPAAWWSLALGGGLAIAASAGLAVLAVAGSRLGRLGPRARAAAIGLAAVPGLALAATFVLGLAGGTVLPDPRPTGLETYPGTVHLASAAVASSLYGTLGRLIPLLLMPIVVWQAATWARASRAELAAPLVRRVDVRPWLLPGVIGAKVAWMALAYAGWLPASLGGASAGWQASRDAGPVAWAIAIAWAIGAGAWLAMDRSPGVSEQSLRPGLRFLVAGFTAGSAIGALLLVAGAVLLLLPDDRPGMAAIAGASLAGDLTVALQLLTVAAALAAGIVLLRRGSPTGAFLAVAGAWMAPRALFVVAREVGLVAADADSPLGVDLVTLDTALTLALAVLTVAWVGGRRRGADPGALALALAATTLMAHAGTLVPVAAGAALATAGILFPPFRTLLFGAREHNEASPVRAARVLGLLGRLGAALLVVAGTYAIVGVAPVDAAADLGRLLFGPPYAALLVASAITVRRGLAIVADEDATRPAVAEPGEPEPGAPEPAVASVSRRPPSARHAASAAGGILAVAAAAAIAGVAVDPRVGWAWEPVPPPAPAPSAAPPASPTPAPPTDAGVFRALVAGVAERMASIGAVFEGPLQDAGEAELAPVGDDLTALADASLAWRRAQPTRACLDAYAAAADAYFAAAGRVGAAVAAYARGTGTEAALVDAFGAFDASLTDVERTLDESAAACGLPAGSGSPPPSSGPG